MCKVLWEIVVVGFFLLIITFKLFFSYSPSGSDGKASACNAGDPGSIPGLGRSPGEENGNPLQYYCLENPLNSPRDHKELDMTERLSMQ